MMVRCSIIHILIIIAVVYFIFSLAKGCRSDTADLSKDMSHQEVLKEKLAQQEEKLSLPMQIFRYVWESYKVYWWLKAEPWIVIH